MECSEQAVSNGYMYYRHLLPADHALDQRSCGCPFS